MEPVLHYGSRVVKGFLPKKVLDEARVVKPELPKSCETIDPKKGLEKVFSDPVPSGFTSLQDFFDGFYRGGVVSLIIDDHTRPNIHTKILLPMFLEKLRSLGVSKTRVRIVVATGTHRAPRGDELRNIMGEAWPAYRDNIVVHDSGKNLVCLGELDGVPVEVNRVVASSELVIPLTDLEYHYFAGVSGGPKSILPGVTGAKITTFEHLKMFGELGFARGVARGVLRGNPVYEYKVRVVKQILDRLAQRGTWVYGVACVLNPSKRFVYLAGGDLFETHLEGKKVLDLVYTARLRERVDVVFVSAKQLGLNLYQAGKAVHAAKDGVKPGGWVVTLAPCFDGVGRNEFLGLMRLATNQLGAGGWQADLDKETGLRLIEKVLRIVQGEVVRRFKIGKQKVVDLLTVLLHVGWGHLVLVEEGLSSEERKVFPFKYPFHGLPPEKRLLRWVEQLEQEHGGELTYCLLDDPGLLIRVA
ncbi:MAG: hypothetical protein DRO11_03665 [Methanobacteriota archaeon]|nr:MAG: hypothetical protein DRO11_03665 [Euryarchaeota archaeon]